MFHSSFAYDPNSVCQSRVCDDLQRQVNFDEIGQEVITFVKVDYPKIQASHGNFMDWSLKSLISAGINPDFGIKTGFNTRLDGFGFVSSAVEQINNVVDSDSKSE